MVASRFVLLAAAATVSASLTEDNFFGHLLKRQEPGTPAYNCHDNCGQAITLSRAGGDICTNDAFLNNYANCIQCSGPDNYNIWRYYGNSLSSAGSGCGLETTPKSGKQDDVPPPQTGGSTPSSTAAPEEPTSSTPVSTSAEPTSETPKPTSEVPTETTAVTTAVTTAETTAAPEETPSEYPTGSETPEETAVSSTAVGPIVTSSPSGIPTPSGNGTASYTYSPPQQTVNAASGLEVSAGMFGAIVMGMMYGLGN